MVQQEINISLLIYQTYHTKVLHTEFPQLCRPRGTSNELSSQEIKKSFMEIINYTKTLTGYSISTTRIREYLTELYLLLKSVRRKKKKKVYPGFRIQSRKSRSKLKLKKTYFGKFIYWLNCGYRIQYPFFWYSLITTVVNSIFS